MTLEELQVLITAETSGLKKELNNMKTQMNTADAEVKRVTNRMSNSFNMLGKAAKAVVGLFAIKEIVSFGTSSVKAFNSTGTAAAKLQQVMKNTMSATKEQVNSAYALIAAQEAVGVVSQDVQTAAAQEISTYLTQASSLKKLMPVLNDMVAQQYGLEASAEAATNIATMMGKVMDGQVGGLSRYGYSFTKAQEQILKFGNEEQRAATLAEVVRQSVGGMNESLAKTPAGQIKQAQNSLALVKEEIGKGIMSAIQVTLPYINAMTSSLMAAAQAFSSFMAAIFGTNKVQMQTATAAAKAQIEVGDAIDEAGKKAKKGLAGFDEINQLQESMADNGDGSAAIETPAMDISAIESQDISPIADEMQKLADKIKGAFEPATEALGRLKTALEPLKTFAAQGLSDFYNNFLSPVGKWTLGEGLPRFIDAISNGLAKTNFETINASLKNLWDAITPFAVNVGEGLLWFWENVLVPLGTWTMNNVVPAFLDVLSVAIGIVNSAIEVFKPAAIWWWDNWLKPIAVWQGELFVASLSAVGNSLKSIGSWMSDNKSTVQGIAIAVGAFIAAWELTSLLAFVQMSGGIIGAFNAIKTAIAACTVAKIVDKAETIYLTALYARDLVVSLAKGTAGLVYNTACWVANTAAQVGSKLAVIASTIAIGAMSVATSAMNVVVGIATTVTTAFGAAIAFLTSPIGLVVLAIGALIAVGILLYTHWDEISAWLKDLWQGIKDVAVSVWTSLGDFFTELWDEIKSTIISAWTAVKDFFISLWEWLKTFIVQWGPIILTIIAPFLGIPLIIMQNWETIKGFMIKLWDDVSTALSNAWMGIKQMASDAWNGIWDIIKSVINSIIGGINRFIGAWNSISLTVPSVEIPLVGKVGGFTIGVPKIPNIPMLAKGGIVDANNPMMAIIGDNPTQKEVVSPLGDLRDMIASAVGSAVMAAMQFNNNSGSNGDIILQIDGTTFARIIGPFMDGENTRQGNPMILKPV